MWAGLQLREIRVVHDIGEVTKTLLRVFCKELQHRDIG